MQVPRLREIIRIANDLAALGMTTSGKAYGTTEVVPFPQSCPYLQCSCFLWPIWKRARRVINASQKHEASRGAPGSSFDTLRMTTLSFAERMILLRSR